MLAILRMVLGMLAYLGRSLLLSLRLAPRDWTAVQLQFSPALRQLGKENGREHDSVAAAALPGRQAQGEHVEDPAPVAAAVPALREIVLARCPALVDPRDPHHHYRPTPYLASGQAQTIYSAFRKTVHDDPVRYRRRVLLTPDGGTLSIDVAPPALAARDEAGARPTLVVVTGLTGGSAETYVRHVVRPLVDDKGWRAVVMNYRACAYTPATSAQLYSGSKTSDLATAILFAQQNWPASPLVAVGFSLGANVLAKYLGEYGDATPLRGGLVVAGPYSLPTGTRALEDGGFNQHAISKAMCGNLMRVFTQQADVMSLSPDVKAQLDRLTAPKTVVQQQAAERGNAPPYSVRWFDDNATRLLGGYAQPYGEFPFQDAWAYYRGGSAANVLHRVARPLLAIHARDDPVVPYECAQAVAIAMGAQAPPADQEEGKEGKETNCDPSRDVVPRVLGRGNPNLVLASTEYGGHLGWWTGSRPTRWLRDPALQWLTALMDAPELKQLALPPNPHGTDALLTTEVTVDVLPASCVRPYVPAAQRSASPAQEAAGEDKDEGVNKDAGKDENEDETDEAAVEGATQPHHPRADPTAEDRGSESDAPAQAQDRVGRDRLAFLTTPVLGDTPLLHPFQHEYYQDATLGAARRAAACAGGELGLKLQMVQDKSRLAVGYAELPLSTRVAGVGDVFLAGAEVPGDLVRGTHAPATTDDGVVPGL